MHTLEYQLRYLLNSSTMKILGIKELTSSEKISKFSEKYPGSKKIRAFTEKPGNITYFPLLGVPLKENSTIHNVVFCEVAVGRSLFVTKTYAEDVDVPAGIDSLVIDNTDNVSYLQDTNLEAKKMTYVIKDQAKILPLYEISFEYDEEFERKSRGKCPCDKCTEKDAVVFCPSERASFCKDCDEIVHSDNFLKRHERKYFDSVGQKKFIACPDHSSKVVEYFCDVCFVPMCPECKISGEHSKPEFFSHKTSSFIDGCRSAVQKIKEENPVIENYAEILRRDVEIFKDKVNETRKNFQALRKTVEKEFKNIIHQLDNLESQQRQMNNAKYAIKIAELINMENISTYPTTLDPADLLIVYKNIFEQRRLISAPQHERYEFEPVELSGKLVLKTSDSEIELGKTSTSCDERVLEWNIESLVTPYSQTL